MPSTMSNRHDAVQQQQQSYSLSEIQDLTRSGYTITLNFDSGIYYCTVLNDNSNWTTIRTSRASLANAILFALGEISEDNL